MKYFDSNLTTNEYVSNNLLTCGQWYKMQTYLHLLSTKKKKKMNTFGFKKCIYIWFFLH